MPAAVSHEVSRTRKLAALALMVGAGGIVAREGWSHSHVEWPLLAFAAVLGIAGLGMTRRSLVVQVLSRGAAWVTLFPSLLVTGFTLMRGSTPNTEMTGLALATASALLLARPMLHTKEAREPFAPKAFRRWFLAGSTATAATAIAAGAIALDTFPYHPVVVGAFLAIALSLLASAVGVVRMRGWGIVLGAATSTILLVSALFMRGPEAVGLGLFAMPTLLLHLLPLLIARAGGAANEPSVRPETEPAFTSVHYRVAPQDDDLMESDEGVSPAPGRMALRV
jgi:hypothetical protein